MPYAASVHRAGIICMLFALGGTLNARETGAYLETGQARRSTAIDQRRALDNLYDRSIPLRLDGRVDEGGAENGVPPRIGPANYFAAGYSFYYNAGPGALRLLLEGKNFGRRYELLETGPGTLFHRTARTDDWQEYDLMPGFEAEFGGLLLSAELGYRWWHRSHSQLEWKQQPALRPETGVFAGSSIKRQLGGPGAGLGLSWPAGGRLAFFARIRAYRLTGASRERSLGGGEERGRDEQGRRTFLRNVYVEERGGEEIALQAEGQAGIELRLDRQASLRLGLRLGLRQNESLVWMPEPLTFRVSTAVLQRESATMPGRFGFERVDTSAQDLYEIATDRAIYGRSQFARLGSVYLALQLRGDI